MANRLWWTWLGSMCSRGSYGVNVRALIEMQVVNPKDADALVNQIAARVRDPRAAKWMRRTGRHMLLNPDLLYSEPLEIEPLVHSGSKQIGRGGRRYNIPHHERPSMHHYSAGGLADPVTGAVSSSPWVGEQPKEEFAPETLHSPSEKETEEIRQRIKGYTKVQAPVPREQTEAVWQIRRLIRRLTEAEKPGKNYSTILHRPVVKADIEQNYDPYKPARKPAHLGKSPQLSKLEPWAKISHKEHAKEEPPPDLSSEDLEQWKLQHRTHYFKPFKAASRNMVKDLNAVADWFNWLPAEDPIFKNLTMPAGDVKGYRTLVAKARAWKRQTEDEPWLLVKDFKELSRIGNLSLHKMVLPATVVGVNNSVAVRSGPGGTVEIRKKGENEDVPVLPGYGSLTREWSSVGWCTREMSRAKSYLSQAPLYMINKDGLPWIEVHPDPKGTQAKTPDNKEIGMEVARQVAPLFNNPQALAALQQIQYSNSGLGAIKRALDALRGQR